MDLNGVFDGEELISMEDEISVEEDGSSGADSSPEQPSDSEEQSESGDEKGPLPQELNAETQIEDDFEHVLPFPLQIVKLTPTSRLINNIKLTEGTSGGLLAKDWDFGAQDQDAQFKDDLRLASGIGKRRRKKGSRTVGPTLSFEVRSLLGDGNQAYVDGNLPEAVRIMLEVIRIEPRAASAWSVLAQCHEDMKQDQQALQLRIMAAHLRHDADEWDRLARQSKELGYNHQALYCWGKLSKLDPSNVNAQWDRALLARDMGDLKTTRSALLLILKRFPHDLAVLSELRTILVEISDLTTCTTLFQAAFEHYQKTFPSGRGHDPATNQDVAGGGFGHLEILMLADLYNTAGDHNRAVDVIRQGCRWLQGRAEHRYWDMCDDDREYDLAEFNRNVESEPQPGMFPLDVNARHRLAVARIKMGEIEEAKLHVSAILSEDALDYAPLFVETADAYFEREMYAEARPIYELLGAEASTSSLYILLQTATCMRMLNELREAVDVYEYIRLVEPTHNEAKMKLAEIYEILNEPRKALDLVYEVIDSRKKGNKTSDATTDQVGQASQPSGSASLFAEEKDKTSKSKRSGPRMTVEALKEMEATMERDAIKSHRRITELWPNISREQVNESEREWLLQAEKMVESFRETRQLFTTSNQAFRGMFPTINRSRKQGRDAEADEDRMASRLHLALESSAAKKHSEPSGPTNVFRGLHFDDWLKIFFQYAFLLTIRGQHEKGYEVLKHISLSNPFRAPKYQNPIRLAIITCAVFAQDFPVIVDNCRKVMSAHQFNNEPLRLLLAAISSGLRATDAFITSTLQKVISREMRVWHFIAKMPDQVRWVQQAKRFSLPHLKPEDVNDDGDGDGDAGGQQETVAIDDAHPLPDAARKASPVVTALYGQMSVAAKGYQTAIFYLLQAYEQCPQDPMISLSLAIASAGRTMQRQADNRHHLATQTFGFLSRYREFRQEQPDSVGEIDFNFGRAFQQLGLYSHAVTHYEKVLALAEAQDSKNSTVAQEAAYNLSSIYTMSGAIPLAKALYRRWLSF
ncbi:TPR-like protein [Mycena galericulata]|nr:TPR-like protein [Mycena galericulata]